jgi:outer membrane receptor protein involved in Fe transport
MRIFMSASVWRRVRTAASFRSAVNSGADALKNNSQKPEARWQKTTGHRRRGSPVPAFATPNLPLRTTGLALAAAAAFPVMASDTPSSPVVVTATREARPSFDLPVSIDVIEAPNIQFAQPQVNAAESLVRIPGITANNRYNYAQDPQIQTRGFGARSQFGVRGIRIYQDGIPLSTPDGQGQTSTFNLSSAQSIKVMRGPFSALYGNSSGGVVQIFTKDAPSQPTLSSTAWYGTYNTHRENVQFGARYGLAGLTADVAHFESDGYRQNSAVQRDTLFARIDNLLDRHFIGAVRVNDTNGAYYEAAPGRFGLVGVTANYAF